MKIAIVCDWLVTVGGAEKLLGHILQCYPEADLYAVVDFIDADKRDFLLHKKIKTTFIQKLPFARKHYRHYLPLMPIAIEQLDLSSYQLIISSSHAVAKGIITGPDQLHISYVHSPMRYAWDLQHQYLRETGLDKKAYGLIARYLLHKLRLWDLRSANGVDYFIANSHFIARRINKIYRRNAYVIHPPIEISQFTPSAKKCEFYLTASRLVPYKKIDTIVESFSHQLDRKLIVVGDGPDYDKIKAKASANVKMLGYQPTTKLIELMQQARAFIFAAEEDFGLLPVEAQACGTPVIAFGKGGALETVRGLDQENPTGLFFNEQTSQAIVGAVEQFEKNEHLFNSERCSLHAKPFGPEYFYRNFKNFVKEKLTENKFLT